MGRPDDADWILRCLECGREEMKNGCCAFCNSDNVEIMAVGAPLPPVVHRGKPANLSGHPRCRWCLLRIEDHAPEHEGRRKCISTLGPGAGKGYWEPF